MTSRSSSSFGERWWRTSAASFDWTRIQKRARNPPDDDVGVLQTWWSDKYGLPANDPRFLNRPFALHARAFLEDLVRVRDQVKERLRHGEGSRDELEETLQTVERVLGIETGSVTDWQAEVEKALEEGRMPDWGA